MIEFTNLNKSFGKNHVLNNLDLEIRGNSITAVIGPNGSGKTTLIKSLLGLVIPDSGEIKLDGINILGKSKFRNQIAYLPQIARFPENLNGMELIDMIKNLRNSPANANELIQLFDFEKELYKKVGTLSGGNKQKLNLLLCLMFDNPLIILDEPSNGLDPIALINLKTYLKNLKLKGKTIVLTTHIMSFIEELVDNIIFLLNGKIYYNGSLEKLLQMENTNRLELAIANILLKSQNK